MPDEEISISRKSDIRFKSALFMKPIFLFTVILDIIYANL